MGVSSKGANKKVQDNFTSRKMAKMYYILAFVLVAAGAASAFKIDTAAAAVGSISSDQDEEQRSTPGNCSSVPAGYCAVLYDDEDCAGWSFVVPSGTYDLPEELRNDAEVVVVGAGCKFTGYDSVGSRGASSFCDALNSPVDRFCDIFDNYLRDSYDSVECLCR